MTAPLPTREDLDELLSRHLGGLFARDVPTERLARAVADLHSALLARLRPAFDELNNEWRSVMEASSAGSLAERDALRADLVEERKIVDRVWKALGVESYEAAGGKSIDELVATLRADLARKDEALRACQSALLRVLEIVNGCCQCVVKTDDGYRTMRDGDERLEWLDAVIASAQEAE